MRDDDHSFVDDAIRDLARAVEAELEEHPEADELLAHSRRELPPERARRVEDHVVWCRDCASFFRDEAAFDDEVEPLPDDEREAQWRALRERLRRADAPEDSTPETRAPAPPVPMVERPSEGTAYPFLRAAALVVGALALGVWIGYLAGGPDGAGGPTANPQILDLVPPESERGSREEEVALRADRWGTLILTTRLADPSGSFLAQVVGEGGEVVLVVPGLVPNEHGNLVLLLPPGALPPGRFTVEVEPGGGGEVVERFPLTVADPGR